jgi:hypothetical protein
VNTAWFSQLVRENESLKAVIEQLLAENVELREKIAQLVDFSTDE